MAVRQDVTAKDETFTFESATETLAPLVQDNSDRLTENEKEALRFLVRDSYRTKQKLGDTWEYQPMP